MSKVQKKLSKLIKKWFPNEDEEIIEYGVFVLLSKTIFMITIIIIGILFDELVSIVVFTFMYTPLRSFAGGIHAKTPIRCYVFSLIMLITIAVLQRYVIAPVMVVYSLLIVGLLVILFLSPVATPNKPLEEIEIKVYKKKTILICVAELLIGITFEVLNMHCIVFIVMCVFITVSIMLILGKIEGLKTKNDGGKK